jgi:hypothetical protein
LDGAYNTMFAVSSAGVIACDAPPTLGANYLRAIARGEQQADLSPSGHDHAALAIAALRHLLDNPCLLHRVRAIAG